jgi:hypothetical protein
MPLVLVGAEWWEEVLRLIDQLCGVQEEAGRLCAHLESRGSELRELRTMALGACRALFPRGARDNAREVNEHLCAMPVCFREAMEDGVQ